MVTESDMQVYEYVREYMLEHGYAPTIYQIKKALRKTEDTVNNAIMRCGRAGMWEYKGRASAIVIPGIEMIEK